VTSLYDELHPWVNIPSFPGYSVCADGYVLNDKTKRILKPLTNHGGLIYVGLMRAGRQQNVLISGLVAKVFLLPPTMQAFDTIINLDGDRRNNHAINLMWRPRWFAMKYHRQFKQPWNNTNPVEELETGKLFEGALTAASQYGLLALEIFNSAMNYTYYGMKGPGVWPTNQHFRMIHPRPSVLHTIPRQVRGL
jgi:hypothetical protein